MYRDHMTRWLLTFQCTRSIKALKFVRVEHGSGKVEAVEAIGMEELAIQCKLRHLCTIHADRVAQCNYS